MDLMRHAKAVALINYLADNQEQINAGNVDRGFWEPPINPFEKPILAQTELSEAIDYHRKGQFGDEAQLVESCKAIFSHEFNAVTAFDKTLKGTVVEEIADTAIRVADFYGLGVRILTFSAHGNYAKKAREIAHSHYVSDQMNFCERAGSIIDQLSAFKNSLIFTRSVEIELKLRACAATIIYMLAELAEDFTGGVEVLIEVIEAKLRYNAERPYKHGKTY